MLRPPQAAEVLDACGVGVAVLEPVHDQTGRPEDARVIFVNPSAAPLIGSSDQDDDRQIRHKSLLFVATPLWETCSRVLGDRYSRTVDLALAIDRRDTLVRVHVSTSSMGLILTISDVTDLKYAAFEMEAQKDEMELAKRDADAARYKAEAAHAELCAEIAARRRVEAELRTMAVTDALTGVLNRRGFDEAVRNHAALARRYGHPLAVMSLDIDHFKQVNDTYGHAVGDAVLKGVATLLKRTMRTDVDQIGRVGGEEFMVLLPHTTAAGATTVAWRLLHRIHGTLFDAGGTPVSVTASIGVHELGDDGPERMMLTADDALYAAKRGGRDRVFNFVATDLLSKPA
jgi:diguanylate cyclase (GGDEF)-like protein